MTSLASHNHFLLDNLERESPMLSMPKETPSRREFTRQALQSLTALALIEGLAGHQLFGKNVAAVVDDWFKELNTISKDVADHKIKDVEFQKSLEALYGRVDLPELLTTKSPRASISQPSARRACRLTSRTSRACPPA